MAFWMVYITYGNKEEAENICSQLLTHKLIACSNIIPVQSAYWWNHLIQNDQEWISIVKTAPEKYQDLEDEVVKLHSYEIPCIVKWEVSANAAYEKWIRESVGLI